MAALFSGKISIDDLRKPDVVRLVPGAYPTDSKLNMIDIKLPYFMLDKAKYMQALDTIAKTNGID